MQVQKHHAARGLFWLSDGLRIFGKQPFLLMLLTMIVAIMMLMTVGIPVIGPVISLAMAPPIYVGWMHAIRTCDQGTVPNPLMLFEAFRSHSRRVLPALIQLGLINAVLTIAAKTLALSMAPENATILVDDPQEGIQAPGSQINLWWPIILLALYIPIQMALWYAPLIIAWHGQPVLKSIFFSIVAAWRNKWAFAALFVSFFWLAVAAVVVVQLISAALSLSLQSAQFLMAPAILFMISALQCSFWVTYRDVFTDANADSPHSQEPR